MWGGTYFMPGVMCAWLIFYRTKCRSCFWSFRFLPAASIECEAVLGHVKRLPNTHIHTKKKVTKTMADSLFWAPDRTRPGTQKQSQLQTRDPAIPAPGSATAEAAASSAVGAMGQELEQAIYSYAATWLTKSTCGCRSQYPNKGSISYVVGYTVRILNSICLSNYTKFNLNWYIYRLLYTFIADIKGLRFICYYIRIRNMLKSWVDYFVTSYS